MVDSKKIIRLLNDKDINFFTGVADSTLKNFIFSLKKKDKHLPVYNEGSAISLGLGYYLSTKKLACVYMQNSGLSNAINPLISIAHKKIYSIPCLLIIGWRGSPFAKTDEPQHNIKGKITTEILKLLNIKFIIIRKNKDLKRLKNLISFSKKKQQPVACLIENGTLKKVKKNKIKFNINSKIYRQDVIELIFKYVKNKTKIISTTGFTSREVYEIRKNKNIIKGKDFYMIGGMGHAGMVSLGVAINKKNEALCIDGDGSIMMHLGSLRAQGLFGGINFKHILLNNGSHESVGAQRTFVENINFSSIAKILGYKYLDVVNKKNQLEKKLHFFFKSKGPSFLEIKINNNNFKNLPRPKNFIKIKEKFMK